MQGLSVILRTKVKKGAAIRHQTKSRRAQSAQSEDALECSNPPPPFQPHASRCRESPERAPIRLLSSLARPDKHCRNESYCRRSQLPTLQCATMYVVCTMARIVFVRFLGMCTSCPGPRARDTPRRCKRRGFPPRLYAPNRLLTLSFWLVRVPGVLGPIVGSPGPPLIAQKTLKGAAPSSANYEQTQSASCSAQII